MIKVILTGSTGFVGQNFIEYSNNSGLNIDTISVRNTIDIPSLEDAEAIVHLAGKAHDLKNSSDPNAYYEANYLLTKRLYDRFLISNIKKFIFISSVKAVTDHVDTNITEDFPANPKTPYGRSKLMAEEYIMSQPLPANKFLYILRPCMIHGPGNKGNLNMLYKIISLGVPYPLAAFTNKRSFLSIENLCFVMSELLERNDIPSGIYQVADDGSLSTNELVELIANVSGKTPWLWKISPRLIRFIAKLGDVSGMPLTTERLNKLTENYMVDNSKIRTVLGKELPIKARDGIMKTIRSFKVAK